MKLRSASPKHAQAGGLQCRRPRPSSSIRGSRRFRFEFLRLTFFRAATQWHHDCDRDRPGSKGPLNGERGRSPTYVANVVDRASASSAADPKLFHVRIAAAREHLTRTAAGVAAVPQGPHRSHGTTYESPEQKLSGHAPAPQSITPQAAQEVLRRALARRGGYRSPSLMRYTLRGLRRIQRPGIQTSSVRRSMMRGPLLRRSVLVTALRATHRTPHWQRRCEPKSESAAVRDSPGTD